MGHLKYVLYRYDDQCKLESDRPHTVVMIHRCVCSVNVLRCTRLSEGPAK